MPAASKDVSIFIRSKYAHQAQIADTCSVRLCVYYRSLCGFDAKPAYETGPGGGELNHQPRLATYSQLRLV